MFDAQTSSTGQTADESTAPLPKVSFGMPVYNGEPYLREALDSLLNQTFTDSELVISDNGSTDATESICREYARRDPRVRYFREEVNRGAGWNFNRVFELSRGEYFKWSAADDVCAPTFVERCVEKLETDDSVVCCHSRTMHIDTSGRVLHHLPDPTCESVDANGRFLDASSSRVATRFLDVLLGSGWSARSSGVVRADAMRRTGLIKPYYGWEKVVMGELSLMGRFYDLPETLFFQRIHSNASSNIQSAAEQIEFIDPSSVAGHKFPRLRLLQGHLSSVFRHPLGPVARILCLFCVLRYLLQVSKWRRHLIGLWKGSALGGPKHKDVDL